MTRLARWGRILAVALLVLAHAATSPAQTPRDTTVIVLPFQVNAGPDLEYLNDDLPELISQRLVARGLTVIARQDTQALVRDQRVTNLDVSIARDLSVLAGAGVAVYGSFNQVGEGFSIDVRVVDALGIRAARPFFIQKEGLINILPAVDELAERIASDLLRRNTLADVKVRGTKVLDPDVVLMRLTTRKGDPVDPAAINREVKRIWDLGYFSDVQANVEQDGEGLILVYTVQEKPRIENVTVEGSDKVDVDDILAAMSTKTGSVLNEKLLAQDLQKVTELYRKEGYYLAKVSHRIDSRAGGSGASLVLKVEEGKKLYIKKVAFEGIEKLDADDLKKQLALSERGMFSWITGSGVLKDEHLERDSAAITAYCMNHGYLDAMVAAPKVDYEEDGIIVTFAIKEGPRYKLGEVTFAGDLIEPDARLSEIVKLDDVKKEDGYFRFNVMQEDNKALTDFYADYGYAFAEVNPRTRKHEDEPVVDVAYTVNKRQKVYIRRALVEGNDKTRDNVILRELRITDGDMFEGKKLRRSAERLNRLQYFEAVSTELVPTDHEDEVDLKVKVKEKNTGALIGGIGYSTYYEFGVSGTIMERNLFGKGYQTSFMALFSGRRTAYQWSFTNPRYNDTNLSVGYDAYNIRDEYTDFSKNTIGNTVRFAYPIGEYTTVGWGYRLDFYKLYDVEDDAADIIHEREGDNVSSVVHGRITRDTTDSKENPTRGNITKIFTEYGGGVLMGDDNFFKPTVQTEQYYQWRPNHVLHGRVRGGVVLETKNDEEVPVFERFYIGGIDSIRGYSSKDISPRDKDSGDRIGGDRMAFANMEYIWVFEPDLGLALGPFFAVGFHADSSEEFPWDDALKKAVGLEFRWRSPMGDLRFAYGYPLDENREGDKTNGRFEFSMGQFF